MMQILIKLLELAIVLGLGYLLTTRVLPWLFKVGLRLLGYSTQLSPVTAKRLRRFRAIRRGFWCFQVVTVLFVTSFFLELTVNSKALMIRYDGKTAFPAVSEWLDLIWVFGNISSFNKKSDFGQIGDSEVDYRQFARYAADPSVMRAEVEKTRSGLAAERAAFLAKNPAPGPDAKPYQVKRHQRQMEKFAKSEETIAILEKNLAVFEQSRASCWMPVYPVGPGDLRHDLASNPPNRPSLAQGIPLGTDLSGRDVVPLLLYGFRISLAFALVVSLLGYAFGILIGGIQGYYGGWLDIVTQRFVEIWGSIPFLFTIMIIASAVQPSFWLLTILMVILTSWLGITYYVRAEFFREKAKDYVQAAIGSGVSDWRIITRHILPNALVPVVTFAPFGIVAYIGSLVSLDFLGFGLPPGTPSWGALLRQGLENVKFYPHLTIIPTVALAATLYTVVTIGEAVREAFDPKVFSRLR
ncbi:MAG: ABC transporter permease subunit [Candidatus Riflebacteria bacterium]|nr:ABC transporter permease subunit [Candidatus Riflebacteria bacterium]